jgi:hypothetical protein
MRCNETAHSGGRVGERGVRRKDLLMVDPLGNFDWSSLYKRYDERCVRFCAESPLLACFGADRPKTDRELYYRLVQAYEPNGLGRNADPIGVYKALLYWKLYSQPSSNLSNWEKAGEFIAATKDLSRLLADLPASLDRDADKVVCWAKQLDNYRLPGMKSSCAIPVRSTFLHFVYPHVVPIFDRMVLRAIGESNRKATNYSLFKKYLHFAWNLAERYKDAAVGRPESPLRLVEMALWVVRDSQGGG